MVNGEQYYLFENLFLKCTYSCIGISKMERTYIYVDRDQYTRILHFQNLHVSTQCIFVYNGLMPNTQLTDA